MKRILKIVFLTTLVISLFMTNLVNAAEPTVTVDPAAPVSQGEVTFTATIDDENVIGVYIVIQECDTEQCFPATLQNLTTTLQTDGTYKATTDLILADMYYIQYTLVVHTSEGWITYLKDTQVYLAEGGNGNGSSDDDDNGSPGFEIIVFLAAIAISIVLLKRKRS